NLGFKFAYSRVRDKPVTNIRWPLADCLGRVRIFDVEYRFHLRKDSDHNIYMNPFFHEFDVSNFVHSALKPGDVFVDVGAYAGSYTLAAAKIVGPKGKVVSIEPNAETLPYLKENASRTSFFVRSTVSRVILKATICKCFWAGSEPSLARVMS